MNRTVRRIVGGLLAGLLAAGGWVAWRNLRDEEPLAGAAAAGTASASADAATVERGRYLALAGNCAGCHTADDGVPFAGGRGIETPFGTVYAGNLTPDRATGLGDWTAAEFRRALHNGRARDGRLLYPAFPYPSYTRLSRADADALYAYLRTVAPVARPDRPHALQFPFGTQPALAVWRALYFTPSRFEPDPARGAAWNRGRYLVDGLGHCAACHSPRNALGGIAFGGEFAGGPMPDASWYAPSLARVDEAGVAGWPRADVVALLRHGTTAGATVVGPMADVVWRSTRHLTDSDLDAIADYLSSLPPVAATATPASPAPAERLAQGERVYGEHCASCHGRRGQGVAGIYPALAGNRAVTLASPVNLIQTIRLGGFAPATAGNPRPFGMPPFYPVLGDDEVAAVATYVRQAWGNAAPMVRVADVVRVR